MSGKARHLRRRDASHADCRKSRIGAALAILGLGCGCAGNMPGPAAPVMESAHSSGRQQVPDISSPVISGRWGGGRCSLDPQSGKLSYRSKGRSRHIRLDFPGVELEAATDVFFGAEATVILTPGHIVTTLGGDDILRGEEVIGPTSSFAAMQQNTMVHILHESIARQGITASAYAGGENSMLYLLTGAGHVWEVQTGQARARARSFDIMERDVGKGGGMAFYRNFLIIAEGGRISVVQFSEGGDAAITATEFGRWEGTVSFSEESGFLQVRAGGRSFRVEVSGDGKEVSVAEETI